MKKSLKRFLAFLFVFVMAISVIPKTSVAAATYPPKSMTIYDFKENNSYSLENWNVGKNAKIKNVKVSDRSVVFVTGIEYSKYKNENNKTVYSAYVCFKTLKAGTATITYKIGTKTKSVKITVKPYKNLISSAKIFGITENGSTQLASATKDCEVALLEYPTNPTNKIQIQAKTGFDAIVVEIYDDENHQIYEAWPGTGKISKTVNLPPSKVYTMYIGVADHKNNMLYFYKYVIMN